MITADIERPIHPQKYSSFLNVYFMFYIQIHSYSIRALQIGIPLALS